MLRERIKNWNPPTEKIGLAELVDSKGRGEVVVDVGCIVLNIADILLLD